MLPGIRIQKTRPPAERLRTEPVTSPDVYMETKDASQELRHDLLTETQWGVFEVNFVVIV